MASLTDALASMKNKNTQTTPVVNQRYQVQYINYSYLEESAYNFYPMSEIEELADRRHPATAPCAPEGTRTTLRNHRWSSPLDSGKISG